ncbi:hypothetical protein L288_17825 [Sphingobium quisquiliarum P25]|uniref:Uncharacterized protein n=1 Tax=Sphingobium quisquiliarum P25 TaxID=1329909 RepID=T0HVB4_9SPHN|nr:hypothetical protein L288_17825 [Sphingobium quisquiliarum P25]
MTQRMICLPGHIVDHMRANCPGRTDEKLQESFGISYNTWRRIDAGLPIRVNLAERIVQRVNSRYHPEAHKCENERKLG